MIEKRRFFTQTEHPLFNEDFRSEVLSVEHAVSVFMDSTVERKFSSQISVEKTSHNFTQTDILSVQTSTSKSVFKEGPEEVLDKPS